ncbi:MAG: type IV secretory system conjugative DNA transfer family protein [Spirosomataceae bacterium]
MNTSHKKPIPMLLLGWEKEAKNKGIGFKPNNSSNASSPQKVVANTEIMHQMTFASTGSGKGRCVIIPNLITYPGPVIVIDPKGENYLVTARARREMGQQVVCIDPFNCVGGKDTLNPLDLIHLPNADVESDAQMLASMLAVGNGFSKDPFWDNCATGLISGLIAYTLTCDKPVDRNFNTIRQSITADDAVYNLAVKMDTNGKKMPPMAYEEFCAFMQMPERETRPSVLATAKSYLNPFMSDQVIKTLAQSSFRLEDVREGKPLTIYLVIPPDKLQSHAGLLRLWVGVLLEAIIGRTEIPPLKTLFILDEVAQLGHFKLLETIITLCRGYGVACWSFWQDIHQLKSNFPSWPALLNNCHTWQFFGITKYQVAKEVAEVVGLPASALMGMPSDEQIVVSDGSITPLFCHKMDYLKDKVFKGYFDDNPFYKNHPPHRTTP